MERVKQNILFLPSLHSSHICVSSTPGYIWIQFGSVTYTEIKTFNIIWNTSSPERKHFFTLICSRSTFTISNEETFCSRFFGNSDTNVSELLENLKEILVMVSVSLLNDNLHHSNYVMGSFDLAIFGVGNGLVHFKNSFSPA